MLNGAPKWVHISGVHLFGSVGCLSGFRPLAVPAALFIWIIAAYRKAHWTTSEALSSEKVIQVVTHCDLILLF